MTYDSDHKHICDDCGTHGLDDVFDKCFNCFSGITKRRAEIERTNYSSSIGEAGQSVGLEPIRHRGDKLATPLSPKNI